MRIETGEIGGIRSTPIGDARIADMQFMRWPSGKLFVRYLLDDLIGVLAADMHRNTAAGYDNVVVVQGAEGSGKSNLMWQICHTYDPTFSIRDGYIYDMDALRSRMQDSDITGATLWMDEGSNIANNRDWNTRGNKDLVLFLETMRSRRIMFGMCIPHHERLDVYIRTNRIRYLITCTGMEFPSTGPMARGLFELRCRDAFGRMQLVGYGRYDPMPADVATEYEAVKLRSQEQIIQRMTGQAEKPTKYKQLWSESNERQDVAMAHLVDQGYDRDEIMIAFGYTNPAVFANHLTRGRKSIRRAENEDAAERSGEVADHAGVRGAVALRLVGPAGGERRLRDRLEMVHGPRRGAPGAPPRIQNVGPAGDDGHERPGREKIPRPGDGEFQKNPGSRGAAAVRGRGGADGHADEIQERDEARREGQMTPRELHALLWAMFLAVTVIAAIAALAVLVVPYDLGTTRFAFWAIGVACGLGWAVMMLGISTPTDELH